MGAWSWFGKPADNVKGSYCDRDARSDAEYYEEDELDQQYFSTLDRGDGVIIDDKEEFDEDAIVIRFDDDGNKLEQGPGLW